MEPGPGRVSVRPVLLAVRTEGEIGSGPAHPSGLGLSSSHGPGRRFDAAVKVPVRVVKVPVRVVKVSTGAAEVPAVGGVDGG